MCSRVSVVRIGQPFPAYDNSKAGRSKQMRDMWKLVGIVVFSIAFGMILTVLISNRLASLIVAIILLLVSYNVIFCEK